MEATPHKQAGAARAEVRLEALWRGAREGLWDWDLSAGEMRFSPRWKAILGFEPGEIGTQPDELWRRVHPRDLAGLRAVVDAHLAGATAVIEHEFRLLHKGGGWRTVRCRGEALPGQGIVAGSLADVTEQRAGESRALREALLDPLTGLANRELFLDRLDVALARTRRRPERRVAVLYLDLDRFRTVNDSLGPGAGDELLLEVAQRLRGQLRLGDTLARLGGDKFAFLMDGVQGPREAVRCAEEVALRLRRPLTLEGHEVVPRASVGIALSDPEGAALRPGDLLNNAITAMHRAKEDGATLHELFDPEMSERAKDRLRLEEDLRRALERGEFQLHYQPIISFRTGELASFEALVRWKHPQRGFVGPDRFIPIAEENGLIVPLGQWVLDEACSQMARWRDVYTSTEDVAMAVNLSARQFDEPDLVAAVGETLERSGLAAGALKLEMTESVIMARTHENKKRLQELRDLGIRLSIDDFGTGYSSLASLHSFPLDSLKIDRSFVSRMEYEEDKAEIVRIILDLGRRLGMDVVAEGVETVEQLDMLRGLECPHGQGYYFSSAVDGDAAESWLVNPPRW